MKVMFGLASWSIRLLKPRVFVCFLRFLYNSLFSFLFCFCFVLFCFHFARVEYRSRRRYKPVCVQEPTPTPTPHSHLTLTTGPLTPVYRTCPTTLNVIMQIIKVRLVQFWSPTIKPCIRRSFMIRIKFKGRQIDIQALIVFYMQ